VAKFFMVVAAVIDGALAALMVAVSGFFFGAGPESMHGGGGLIAAYAVAVLACLAAPVAGFILNRKGKTGFGLAVAWLPPAVALVASMLPPPY
jgi:hypothetical protein